MKELRYPLKSQTYSLFFLLILLCFVGRSHARESMFRLGYSNCVACHVSPRGGQFLTEYGKLISNSISIKKGTLAQNNSKYKHMAKIRLAHVRTEYSNDTFPMQADYLSAFSAPKGKFISSLARSPQRGDDEISTIETLYFREFKYILARKNFVYSFGREPQNLGFFIEDHTSYMKSENRFNVTDLMTKASVDYLMNEYNFHGALFGPSFQEKKENQEYGVKFEMDRTIKKLQVGAGLLIAKGETIDREIFSLNFKIVLLKKLILMGEALYTHRNVQEQVEFDQTTSFLSLSFFPTESIELNLRYENLNKTNAFRLKDERAGAGIDIKLAQNLSLRNDWRRTSSENLYISQFYLNWW